MNYEFPDMSALRHVVDASESLHKLLDRIATALEEQNRISQEWIAAQVDWRAEDRLAREQLAERELRIIDIHQANAEREQAFRDTQIQAYSEHLKRIEAEREELP